MRGSRRSHPVLLAAVLLFASCAIPRGEGGGFDFTGRTLTDAARAERKLPDDARGVLVVSLPEKSPLEATGVRAGDVITAIDGRPVADYEALVDAVFGAGARQTVTLGVLRGDERSELKATSALALRFATLTLGLPVLSGPLLMHDSPLLTDGHSIMGFEDAWPLPWQVNETLPLFETSLIDVATGPDRGGFALVRALGYESCPGNWVVRLLCFDFGHATVIWTDGRTPPCKFASAGGL